MRLSIWSKHGDKSKAKAVLFWLYGGGRSSLHLYDIVIAHLCRFDERITNSFLCDGENLVNTQDVIVLYAE